MNYQLSILGPKVTMVCKKGFYPTFSQFKMSLFFPQINYIRTKACSNFQPRKLFLPKEGEAGTEQPGQRAWCVFYPGDHCLLAVGTHSLSWAFVQYWCYYHMSH